MQSVLKPDSKILIFADTREFGSRVVEELARLDCIIKPKMLEVADFLLSDRVAVERKTDSDFLQSIIDRRLFEQAKSLTSNFQKPLLIIEGNDLYKRNLHPNAVRGALASLAIDYGLPIIWTEDGKDTAHMLYWIAKREQIEGNRTISIRGKRTVMTVPEQQRFLIAGLPGVNHILAGRLLKHFKTPENVFNASEDKLQKVRGIGSGLAKRIKILLTKEYHD